MADRIYIGSIEGNKKREPSGIPLNISIAKMIPTTLSTIIISSSTCNDHMNFLHCPEYSLSSRLYGIPSSTELAPP